MKPQVLEKQHLAASPEAGSCNSGAWLHCSVNSEALSSGAMLHCTVRVN